MSRHWTLGLATLAFFSLSISVCPAQNSEGRMSLADRFSSIRDAFRRDDSSDHVEQIPSEEPGLLGNFFHSSGHSSSRTPRTRASAAKRMQQNSPSLPRIPERDLLPDGIFGIGSKQEPAPHNQTRPTPRPHSANLPRPIDSSRRSAAENETRQSPSTRRENELDAALAELIQNNPENTALAEEPSQESPQPAGEVRPNEESLDLHRALIGGRNRQAESASSEPTSEDVFEEAAEDRVADELPIPPAPTAESRPSQNIAGPSRSRSNASSQDGSRLQEKTRPAAKQPHQLFSTQQESGNPIRSNPTPKPESSAASISQTLDVLQSQQQAVLVSRVAGPRSILVGREATYEVTLENVSKIDAKSVSAEVRIPAWAELVDAISTSGSVERPDDSSGMLKWNLNQLAAQDSQSIRLQLIPRSGKPMNLSMQWSIAPVQSETLVEVREPKLEMTIAGPEEVSYGKPQRYRLTLRNPGTGIAEEVSIRLVPPGGDAKSATTQPLGALAPGEVKDVELELTARDAGKLAMQATATAAGGLRAEVVKNVLCRKAELEVDWRGPQTKYAGTEATYYFRIRNTGTAETEPVIVDIQLPPGATMLSSSKGSTYSDKNRQLQWSLKSLAPGEEQFFQTTCTLNTAGENPFAIIASSDNKLIDVTKRFETKVVAVADLKLEVTDPRGPVPVGESTIYEVRIRNRGTTEAAGVNIVGLFSEGIEPTSVEGAQCSIRDGRVSFHPIQKIAQGKEVILKIHATASQPGTHVFRAEVLSQELDIKLAAEETTKFFEDQYRWEDGETPYTADNSETKTR